VKDKAYRFGIIGEYITACWYLLRFCQILKLRFKTKVGEIDLICQKSNTLIFVEVKSRSKDYDDILCSKHQQRRMQRAAESFVLKHPCYANYALQFDLVLIRPYSLPKLFKHFISS
jgi:putative endonuclease